MGMRGGRGNISGRCIALQSAESVEAVMRWTLQRAMHKVLQEVV
jgi:hypothetical protein